MVRRKGKIYIPLEMHLNPSPAWIYAVGVRLCQKAARTFLEVPLILVFADFSLLCSVFNIYPDCFEKKDFEFVDFHLKRRTPNVLYPYHIIVRAINNQDLPQQRLSVNR